MSGFYQFVLWTTCLVLSSFWVIEPLNPTMVWVGKDLLLTGTLPLSQISPSPVQPGLAQFQGLGVHSFSGQPLPGPQHLFSKEFLVAESWSWGNQQLFALGMSHTAGTCSLSFPS